MTYYDLNMNSKRINNCQDPSANQDVATKNYVLSQIGTWADYTPNDVNITLGNGTRTARYVRIGNTVHVSYRLIRGSTTTFNGDIAFGLPTACFSFSMAPLLITDTGVSNYVGNVVIDGNTDVAIPRPATVSASYPRFDNNIKQQGPPFAFGVGDSLSFFITYEFSSNINQN